MSEHIKTTNEIKLMTNPYWFEDEQEKDRALDWNNTEWVGVGLLRDKIQDRIAIIHQDIMDHRVNEYNAKSRIYELNELLCWLDEKEKEGKE